MTHLAGVLGIAAFLGIAVLLSDNRRAIPWRTVAAGLVLQLLAGLLILKTAPGRAFFEFFGGAFNTLLGFVAEGAAMVFGPLANQDALAKGLALPSGFVFLIVIPSTIIVVSALSAALYHYGLLQRVVRGAAWVMRRVMRTSGSETLSAAANIFMGQTEAPLVVKPYLAGMTRSELLALMTGGMATIAGGVMAAYVSFGIDAGHLLTASVMNAPVALAIAKVMTPETQPSQTAAGASTDVTRDTANGLDALCRGAGDGAMLSINVVAMLIAFVATVALVNFLLGAALGLFGVGVESPLQAALGWLNAPFAWLMGVPWGDCRAVGALLGERIVLNEFVGYFNLQSQRDALDPRSVTIATYALCGFANFASIAIQIGGIGALAPSRRGDLARLGVRAMIGGLLACYVTACLAGILV
jgi:CNT family concentrative nucleoside transporter